VHPAGATDWEDKKRLLKEGGAWLLPEDWEARWEKIENINDYLAK